MGQDVYLENDLQIPYVARPLTLTLPRPLTLTLTLTLTLPRPLTLTLTLTLALLLPLTRYVARLQEIFTYTFAPKEVYFNARWY